MEIITCHPWIYTMDHPKLIVLSQEEAPISLQRVNNLTGDFHKIRSASFSANISDKTPHLLLILDDILVMKI